MKRVTIKDIAAHLNLSVSTVSRALADDKNIRPETKSRIFRTAREMGYRRNILAANLRTGRSNTIGVIVNEMITPYASRVLKGINAVMQERGIYVVTCDSDNNPELERGYIRMLEHSLLDGIIVEHCHCAENIEEYKRLLDKGIPLVFFPDSLEGVDAPCVGINSYDKAFFLLDHIVCAGRRRIVNIKGPSLSNEMKSFSRAYDDVMKKFGIKVPRELTVEAGLSTADGERVISELLDKGIEFDGVVTYNELVAIGVMNHLRQKGIAIPDQVSVACFNGSPLSEMLYPPLTAVNAPHEEMGRSAAELLLSRIDSKDAEITLTPEETGEKVVLDSKIMLRESTHTQSVRH